MQYKRLTIYGGLSILPQEKNVRRGGADERVGQEGGHVPPDGGVSAVAGRVGEREGDQPGSGAGIAAARRSPTRGQGAKSRHRIAAGWRPGRAVRAAESATVASPNCCSPIW